MYCPACNCAYSGWTGKCPVCRSPLVDNKPPAPAPSQEMMPYADLVELVHTNGGQLTLVLSAAEVATERKWRFPYSGYGFAWVERMQSQGGCVPVDLATSEVGRRRTSRFPYFGFGYAWARELRGSIGGTEVTLAATEVGTDRTSRFPWMGRGYAWTQAWSGRCGTELEATLSTTDVGRRRGGGFPYKGYGFAWEKGAVLTLTLSKPAMSDSVTGAAGEAVDNA